MITLAFGEDYQGMSDREILIELAGDIKALKDRPACPSPMCGDHESRITRLEVIVTCSAFALATIVALVAAYIGGVL